MKGTKKTGLEKRRLPVAACCIALLFCMVLGGCGKNTGAAGETPEETEELPSVTEEAANDEDVSETETEETVLEEVTVEIGQAKKEELTDEDGTILLTASISSIYVTIPGNQEAEEAVNQFFADAEASYGDTVAEYLDMAREELALREAEEESVDGWNGYELGREYSVKRADDQMISIVEDSYEYTGGAHPNAVRVAYNFDTQTGKRMELEDVASDLDEIRTETVAYLGNMLPESEYAEGLFEDYASHLEDILTDSTWYTDAEGFHVICNEYIITPHAAGILEFVLPYEEVDVVKSEYLPLPAA